MKRKFLLAFTGTLGVSSGLLYYQTTRPKPPPYDFPRALEAMDGEDLTGTEVLKWLRDSGAPAEQFRKLRVANRKNDGERGVFARAPIEKNELVLSVPESCVFGENILCLYQDKVNWSEPLEGFQPTQRDYCQAAIILALMAHQEMGNESSFRPWMDSLPEQNQLPMLFMRPDQFKMMTHLPQPILQNFVKIWMNCQQLYQYCSKDMELDYSRWVKTYSLVQTRSWENTTVQDQVWSFIKYYTGYGKESNPWSHIMFPGLDLLNHSDDPNVRFSHQDNGFRAIRNIAPGEELCWDYHPGFSRVAMSLFYNLHPSDEAYVEKNSENSMMKWPEWFSSTEEKTAQT